MAQEEHAQKYSNSSSGGRACGSGGGGPVCNNGRGGSGSRSSKKMKQKKVPQRGLGVAQLEKIRLEEQQKKDAAASVLTPNPIISPSNSSSRLAVQCPTFRPSISSSSSVPLLPPSPSDLPSPNSIFTPAPPIPNIEFLHPKAVPFSKPLNVSGGEIGWSAVSAPGHGNGPKVRNSECKLEGENQRLDHHGYGCRPNVNLAYESTAPFLPLPNFMQRSPQILPPSSSSMVHISTGISSQPVINFQMEPPSNQNICASNYTPLWPDEEKIIGMKRPYPFSTETPPAPTFHFKFPPSYASPISRLDEPASCRNRSYLITDPGIAVFREGPARLSTVSEPAQAEVKDREHGISNAGFLTLAPPEAACMHLSLKHKQSLANSGLHSQEFSEFQSQPSQGSSEDTIQVQGSSKSIQPPFFSFFPSPETQIGQEATTANNCNGEVGENVDLSLKL